MTDTTSAAPSPIPCGDCGMQCTPGEYHPYAACLMFRACGDSTVVRANLDAVRAQPTQPAVVEPPTRYRLLGAGEPIQAEDEFIADDGVTWQRPVGWEIGMKYTHFLKTARRAIKGDDHGLPT